MHWKALPACAVIFGSVLTAAAAIPMTYKEIAMLLRNGEQPQFILDDTAKRRLLQPLSPQEEKDLAALGATPSLLNALRSPAMLASPQAAEAYQASLQQQKLAAAQQQEQEKQQEQSRIAQQANAKAPLQRQAQPRGNTPGGELLGKPLDLSFTAVDGAAVDLSKLRGKVVLVDFWATWCGPCMHEVPNVVSAYKKYHAKGFEVVGISLDKSKDTMIKVTHEKEMTWPQYFDGNGWGNKISTSFGIHSIPSMWLVNKRGILVSTDARSNLDASIAKLLAE